eukprot:8399443-Heterocapsa_arctica.AAC.1
MQMCLKDTSKHEQIRTTITKRITNKRKRITKWRKRPCAKFWGQGISDGRAPQHGIGDFERMAGRSGAKTQQKPQPQGCGF